MSNIFHPYHLVDSSPWPYIVSSGAFLLTLGSVIYFHYNFASILLLGAFILGIAIIVWCSDMLSEATFQGYHTQIVSSGLKMGMMLFIVSEVCFFMAFFWAFFHSSLAPSVELGGLWPPLGLQVLNPFSVPLLNTAVLLSSGVTVTWAHYAIMNGNSEQSMVGLFFTMFMGAIFTFLQVIEYYEAPFTISDSVYGSMFFMATGFHGFHVLVGTLLLSVCLSSLMFHQLTSHHHFGFEAASWYWHFVDVVWLFLYLCVYWWGS